MASIAGLPQIGDIVGGKYRIERVLGNGGMGAVFEASHIVTGKHFAIKWLLPSLAENRDAIERFIREAQIAGRFQHPNVVEVYDISQNDDSFYMVMELLEGESLGARLKRVGRMSPESACNILLPCMRGVMRAHLAGIVHRDLKPANLFICRASQETEERPKVLDFGISKILSAGDLDASMTKTGMVLGTPHYMSPEQLRGQAVDARTDIYAFGVILYQLLSGKLPFDATSMVDLVLRIVVETPEPLPQLAPEVPSGLADVVSRAMARDAAQRFSSLEAFAQALEPYAQQGRLPEAGATRNKDLGQTPRSSAVGTDTPLATESILPIASAAARPQRPLRLIVLAVVLGIVALGWIGRVLLWRGPDARLDIKRSRSAPADGAGPGPTGDLPRTAASALPATAPHPEPSAAEGWVAPPPHPTEPVEPIAPQEPTAPRPVAISQMPAPRPRKKSPSALKPTSVDIQAPDEARPPEPLHRKGGRLGIAMEQDDF